ncbi:ABC transporter permease [Rhodococcus triatomae]|uniref:D-methionine transport system permease protein n=1 Tax=Rhodococcus triatomae TaxID=300028 RepID=A0A1G8B4E1_9NOCA|nr:methionine ABC transporter permease [Rhodococcus triatomae]QNG17584.1 ABC transporter permease [Rhodococcus triatomae]QNG22748.1 ABC transporter permease [Rhodococcus triatomae]SDH28099.1 D-methionine transport system permease protein [Rhodococcus triatomae]
MNKVSWQDSLPEAWEALLETLYMVGVSFVLTVVIGIALGVVLHATTPTGIAPNRTVNSVLGTVVNVGRSLPFVILLVLLIPVTRLVVGTSLGATAAIVPLTIGSVPFFARVVENALREVDSGRVEAAVSMGATNRHLVAKVLLPEAVPGLIAGATLTAVMLVGYSAMAGAVGAGGLGDFAIKYGYQRFNTPVLLVAVVILVVLVQGIQSSGDLVVRRLAHRR